MDRTFLSLKNRTCQEIFGGGVDKRVGVWYNEDAMLASQMRKTGVGFNVPQFLAEKFSLVERGRYVYKENIHKENHCVCG